VLEEELVVVVDVLLDVELEVDVEDVVLVVELETGTC